MDATPEKPAVAYGEICVGLEQRPGRYVGTVQLTDGAGTRARPLKLLLDVSPFYLPPTSSLKNSFGISLFSAAKGHGLSAPSPETLDLLGRYYTSMLSHRLSEHGGSMQPALAPTANEAPRFDFSAYEKELGPFLSGKALPSGARFTTADVREMGANEPDERRVAYYREFVRAFRARGWKAELFYYAKDEPKPEHYALVQAQSSRARQANVPVLVTSPLHPELAPAADIICPTLNCFFTPRGPATCRNIKSVAELREAVPGKQIWWYQSCNSHGCTGGPSDKPEIERAYSGWASYMVDHPVVLNRAMGPLAYLGGIDGELYFDTLYAYAEAPWDSVFAFGGNGDGTLFYPGQPARVGGRSHIPIESLRLKHLRDGLEDYEALVWLDRLGETRFAREQVQRLVKSGFEVVATPATWDAVRRRIYERISARWARSKYARGPLVGR